MKIRPFCARVAYTKVSSDTTLLSQTQTQRGGSARAAAPSAAAALCDPGRTVVPSRGRIRTPPGGRNIWPPRPAHGAATGTADEPRCLRAIRVCGAPPQAPSPVGLIERHRCPPEVKPTNCCVTAWEIAVFIPTGEKAWAFGLSAFRLPCHSSAIWTGGPVGHMDRGDTQR